MAVKKFKPTSAGLRAKRGISYDVITSTTPEKSLLVKQKRKSGRNNEGKITVRHRGGGNAKHYRLIDFKRTKDGVPGVVKSVEYDPNRSANIALIHYLDGEKRYIIAPNNIQVGQQIESGADADIQVGNTLPLSNIPAGTIIHNIELTIGKGAQLCRAAGAYGTLLAKSGKYANVKLPSGEVRLINLKCRASIGTIGNHDRRNTNLGKAGTNRHLGVRPTVRGSVMNPCDHPHGGGEGRAPIGYDSPRTKWGKKAYGVKTRKDRKPSNKFVVTKRKSRR